ncbi:hypothetical protein Aab01nite_23220 [Paractinoplanes abujensis]|uniref:Uncharacterized protein n=1 Tax=Paractinoplanes abujensis TaxID=882441 RepID=A0A7W7G3Y5_9ACTN|nr:hypothetical protein [Actinoplanes abujensis]MBB4696803.1 hypothetical protein [Actinoplanes abujensis]GID18732.1 hypothetical protein Aab01nite_23220 [Actinoplanes abujensis]
MPQAAEDEPGTLASTIATLRLILGWACAALGVLNLAMGLTSATYVTFHVMLLVTGVLLLGPGRAGRPLPGFAALTGLAVALAGLIGTALPALAVECCSGGYANRHGFPFTMLARDPGGWRFDPGRTVADLVFWLCAGVVVALLVARVRPAPAPTTRPRRAESPWGRPAGHAEPRSTGRHARPDRSRAADDENVGGLP